MVLVVLRSTRQFLFLLVGVHFGWVLVVVFGEGVGGWFPSPPTGTYSSSCRFVLS